MIEIPEAVNLSSQVGTHLVGKTVVRVVAGASPHKFAWFYGEPSVYAEMAEGQTVSGARALGGMPEIALGVAGSAPVYLLVSEGMNVRYHDAGKPQPKKHQLLLEFTDGSALSASAQMYGGVGIYREGGNENPYYLGSRDKPSPLSRGFDWAYFQGFLETTRGASLSAKAFLATEQRIPGLGNGVLQDILFESGIHPKRKMDACSEEDLHRLFCALRGVLAEMAEKGGRDTEPDLFGRPGAYRTRMSKNTVGSACPECGASIVKASYMGGSVYFCPGCQSL
jgi:formamidopyrimidine-DNA glycosylase